MNFFVFSIKWAVSPLYKVSLNFVSLLQKVRPQNNMFYIKKTKHSNPIFLVFVIPYLIPVKFWLCIVVRWLMRLLRKSWLTSSSSRIHSASSCGRPAIKMARRIRLGVGIRLRPVCIAEIRTSPGHGWTYCGNSSWLWLYAANRTEIIVNLNNLCLSLAILTIVRVFWLLKMTPIFLI